MPTEPLAGWRSFPSVMLVAGLVLILLAGPAGAEDLSATIERPFAGDVMAGPVNISGSATGAQGVQVSVDGGSWWNATGASSWSYLWNSTGASNGGHSVQARAYSGSTYAASAPVQFSVNNTPPSSLELTLDLSPQQADTGENFIASGMARFDTGVRVANGTVRISVATFTANATTDRRGYYSASLAAPDTPGRAQVRALLSASGLTGTAAAYLDVVPTSPADLSVSPWNITFVPDKPSAGEEVTIGAVVNNLGGSNASARVRFSTPGHDPQDVPINVSAGGTWNPSVKWSLPSGNHTILVQLLDVAPYDTNSSNDNASMELHVYAIPDLAITALVFSNSRPTEGMTITLQCRISNSGERSATCSVAFYDGSAGNGTLLGARRVTAAANATQMVLLDWNATRGPHNITAAISEVAPEGTRLSVGEMARPLTVSKKSPPAASTPGFESAAAYAVFMVLMVVALKMRSSGPRKK